MNFNQVTLAGRLTRDPELRHIPSGTAVCEIGLAVGERVKRGDQWEDKTHFFDVTIWAKNAENVAKYLRKGSLVLVSGRLNHETWEKDGEKRSKVKVVCDRLQFGPKASNEHDQTAAPSNDQTTSTPPDSEVPF